jgi:hypothetical protein
MDIGHLDLGYNVKDVTRVKAFSQPRVRVLSGHTGNRIDNR